MKLPRSRIAIPLALFLTIGLLIVLAPLFVASGVRTSLWYSARQAGLTVEIASIDAPPLRPVVLHQVRVRSSTADGRELSLDIARAQFGLDLRAILSRSDSRHIRDVVIEDARLFVRQTTTPGKTMSEPKLARINRLFADTFRISHLDVRIEHGSTIVDAHDVSLSASEVEAGSLFIGDLAIASPLLSKRFADLRGATSWQNQRLTLGAITLARGIDVDAITADFSHLAARRIGLEINVDVFGGKVRANVMSDARGGRQLWDVAGTASEISLAQMSETLAWRQPAAGVAQTCKFTFRGDPADALQSTASIWAEVNDLTYGNRSAETIMLGASLYNRRLHLEQLFVKQPRNQFTLSGDAPFSFRADEWRQREVNADLSANLEDVDAFAQLFGARAGEYAGELAVEGTIGVEDRKLRASAHATGEVQLLDARVGGDSRVTADLSCNGGAATLRYAELVRNDVQLDVWGEVAFGDLRHFAATLFPTDRVGDLTAAPSGSCVNGFAFARIAEGDPARSQIKQIAITGGLSKSDWNIALHTQSDAAGEPEVVRTFPLCPAELSADELRLAARAANAP